MAAETKRGRPRGPETLRTVTLSLPAALVERLERFRSTLAEAYPAAVKPSRSSAGCYVLERGLESVEAAGASPSGSAA